jgi:TrmH family RNA methyltransferase
MLESVEDKPSPAPDSFPPAAVRFVLVEPRYAGNVGAAARAIQNLGFSRLVLVRPACDPLGREASMLAVDARTLLERASVCEDLDTALEGATLVVGTTARTGKHRRPHYRLDRLGPELGRLAACGSLAAVFGREDRGLTDAELDRCTHLVYLPGSDDNPSFNLAQAVLLVAYELRRAALADPGPELEPPADHAEREAMYAHLQHALETVGFLHRDSVVPMMRRLRRLLGRAAMTSEEARILRGIAHQVLWVASRAGLAARSGDRSDP